MTEQPLAIDHQLLATLEAVDQEDPERLFGQLFVAVIRHIHWQMCSASAPHREPWRLLRPAMSANLAFAAQSLIVPALLRTRAVQRQVLEDIKPGAIDPFLAALSPQGVITSLWQFGFLPHDTDSSRTQLDIPYDELADQGIDLAQPFVRYLIQGILTPGWHSARKVNQDLEQIADQERVGSIQTGYLVNYITQRLAPTLTGFWADCAVLRLIWERPTLCDGAWQDWFLRGYTDTQYPLVRAFGENFQAEQHSDDVE